MLVNTEPPGASVLIRDVKGKEIFSGTAPATVELKSGAGFFKKAFYSLTVSMPGYMDRTVPVRFGFDHWYWGNVIFGGAIGMLIVDPATGAMYRLKDEYLHVVLRKADGHASVPQLRIFQLDEVPAEWSEHLVALKP